MNPEAVFSGRLSSWVGCVRRNATLTILLCAVVSVAALAAAGLWLGLNSDTMELFPEELGARKNHDAFAALFPDLESALLIVVDAETPEVARTSSERLVAALRADTENFEDAYLPGGGAFFERNALLYQSPEDLEEFSERLLELQPIIGALERDSSIANLAALVRRGLDHLFSETHDAGERDAVVWSDILHRIGRASVEVYQEHPLAISWEELMLRGSAIEVVTRRVVIAHPVLDFEALLPATAPLAAIRSAAGTLALEPERGIRVRVTGNPALMDEETRSLVWDIGVSGAVCLVVVSGILLVALRSGRLALAVVATLLTGLVWTAGFAAIAVGDLSVLSVAAGVLFLGLGVDFGIHFAMRYADLIREGRAHEDALDETTRNVGLPLLLCTATTTIGFFAFLPTDYRGVAELGLITGVGLIIILFLTMTLLPALISAVFRVDNGRLRPGPLRFGARPTRFIKRNAAALRWTALGAAIGGAWLVPSLRFDANIVALRDPSTESVQTFNDLLADADGSSPWYANSVGASLAEADALKQKMLQLGVVSRAITLSDYVPEDQDEKLEILADLAMMMDSGGRMRGKNRAELPVADQIDALRDLRGVLDAAAPSANSETLRASILDLVGKLDVFLARIDRAEDPANSLALLEGLLLASLPAQIERLHRGLQASAIGVEDLPKRLSSRLLAPDGRARVQTFPSENLVDHAAFTRFVDAVQSIDPSVTGVAVNLVEFGKTTQHAFKQALTTAVIVITAILFLVRRRVEDVLLVLAPLSLAAVLTAAWMVLADLPLTFFNVVVIPLLLGAGVDSGIHLVEQSRHHRKRAEILRTTTARAVLFSALTTTTSFGTLAFSSHLGLSGLGALLAVGMTLTVVCNLVVLPALLARKSATQPWEHDARGAEPVLR